MNNPFNQGIIKGDNCTKLTQGENVTHDDVGVPANHAAVPNVPIQGTDTNDAPNESRNSDRESIVKSDDTNRTKSQEISLTSEETVKAEMDSSNTMDIQSLCDSGRNATHAILEGKNAFPNDTYLEPQKEAHGSKEVKSSVDNVEDVGPRYPGAKALNVIVDSPESNNRETALSIDHSVTVFGKIGSIQANFLIDTGAAVSAINSRVWNKLRRYSQFQRIALAPSTNMQTVDGKPLVVEGKINLPIKLSNKDYPFEFHVVKELAYDVILGKDFLAHYQSRIDFPEGILQLQSGDVPTSDQRRAHMKQTMTIPPLSEQIVMAYADDVGELAKSEVMFTPASNLEERYELFGAHMVICIDDNGQIPVRLLNPTPAEITLHCHTTLGTIEPAAVINDSILDQNEEKANSSPAINAIDTDLVTQRDKVEKMTNDCDITADQKAGLQYLLREYLDVFAFTNKELGRTDIVQHTIDTGSHPPIRLPPYRTTPEKRGEIERQVKEMLEQDVIRPSTSAWQLLSYWLPRRMAV